jgi:hypothetical protein
MPQKETQHAPVRMIEDSPATEKLHFGFDAYAQTLAGLVANKENTTSQVVGIFGESGSGKTSLMKAVASRLDGNRIGDTGEYRHCKTVWFNAWKHEGKDDLLAALVESVFKTMDADGFFSLAKSRMDGLTKRIDKSKIFTSVSQLAAGADISEFFSDLVYKEKLGFYDTFQKFFNDLVWTFLYWRFKLSEEEKPDNKKAAFVIFVDDLDRCTGPHIVNFLETIKRFLVRTGWVFVLGGSKASFESALAGKYGDLAVPGFMERMIQVSFELPRISVVDFTPFASAVVDGDDVLMAHLPQLLPALSYNPRRFKRFMNNMHIVHGLARSDGVEIDFYSVLRWGLIDHTHPVLAAHIKDHPQNLSVLQKQVKKLTARMGETPLWQVSEDQLEQEMVPHALRAHIQNPLLTEVITGFDVTPEEFTTIRTYFSSVGAGRAGAFDDSITLPSFMVEDPMTTMAAGPFVFGDARATEVIDAPFDIDIYPVTHIQYLRFMESGGYAHQMWWSESGWQWRTSAAIDRPAGWDAQLQRSGRYPVVGVSWYEAEAYACWAAKALPSEQQWERSARGVDGWRFPWGNDFDSCRCNTRVTGAGATTPVDRYSNGISAKGCYDMAGNVWEWTLSPAEKGHEAYIIKGGAWSACSEEARAASRKGLRPELRHDSVGFRCVHKQS